MTIQTLKNNIVHRFSLMPGWRTKRKIVVFESDDWGMIRMASKKAFNYFKEKGLAVDKCIYNSNDTLESNEDLELLFEVLESVKDKNNKPAIITANNLVANPDFAKIKASDFSQYFFEPFTATLDRYKGRDRVWELYLEGQKRKLFRPQFHGREHLNISNWMHALRTGDKYTHLAFEQNMFSVHGEGNVSSCKKEFLDAFGNANEIQEQKNILKDGLTLFKQLHGYASSSFIAPCYYWSPELNESLANYGIKYLQGSRVQRNPVVHPKKKFEKIYHYTGQKNRFGQTYLMRNASFEVVEHANKDWVNSCLKDISLAFKYKKPAIISVHRVNFIGGINPDNRSRSLKLFKELLHKATKYWPDLEFKSSDQLGNIITKN